MTDLRDFTLADLAQFKKGGAAPKTDSDFMIMFVGRDDVHEALKYLFSRATTSIVMNMFGYDDEELNEILMQKVMDPNVTTLITLDKSQAGGVHEKKLIEADRQQSLAAFNSHFVIGQSATHQISHTKGFVIDGKVAGEGSTNWSVTGEGFFVKGVPGKAQNNTQAFFTLAPDVADFHDRLITEHMIAVKQQKTPAAL
jgi:hypothetical protein